MSEAVFDYFLYNNNTFPTSEFNKIYKEINPSIYEVIRMIDGIPLFLDEHYERLLSSADILGYKLPVSFIDVENNIKKLAKLNNTVNYNVKLTFNNLGSQVPDQYYFFIKSSYPSDEMYRHGVKTTLYSAVRENPNAKVVNYNLRKEVDAVLEAKHCFEALLVNSRGEITEGSRSNAFFIKDDAVYTAPEEDVLAGITRQRIISLCIKNGMKVVENPISSFDLCSFSSAFISGTSPKILPISSIDQINFKLDNPLLLKLIKLYDLEIEKYIYEHR